MWLSTLTPIGLFFKAGGDCGVWVVVGEGMIQIKSSVQKKKCLLSTFEEFVNDHEKTVLSQLTETC